MLSDRIATWTEDGTALTSRAVWQEHNQERRRDVFGQVGEEGLEVPLAEVFCPLSGRLSKARAEKYSRRVSEGLSDD